MTKSQPRTYLVTGAAGFIGARFVESCRNRSIPNHSRISVISVDQERYFKERTEHRDLDFGQVVDLEKLLPWLKETRPRLDAIVHLGAITDTRESNLALLRRLNLEYTQELWSYATSEKIPFIYASSAATYGDGAQGYDDQEELISRLKSLNAYGDSKLQFDLWALEQERNGSHPPTWSGFKFFNVYGFGERHKDFMSSVVLHAFDQIQKSGEVTLFKSHREGISDGHQKRDFVSVNDVVEVLHFALENPILRGIYNLGTGQARTFLDLVRAVFRAMSTPEKIKFIDTPLSIRDKYQYFTEAKMERLRAQGYSKPFASLESGVKTYIDRLLEKKA